MSKRPKTTYWIIVVAGVLILLGITDVWGLDIVPGLEKASDGVTTIINKNIWLATILIIIYLDEQFEHARNRSR